AATGGQLESWADRLAAAHAAEVAERDARIAELEANAADRESEIEAVKAERDRAEDQAEAASGQGVECEHKRTEPRRTHVRCLDCESVKTDSDPSWGAARDRWFPSLPAARAAAAPTQEKGNG